MALMDERRIGHGGAKVGVAGMDLLNLILTEVKRDENQ